MSKKLGSILLGVANYFSINVATIANDDVNLILIHGANFKANSWHQVQNHLTQKVNTVAIDLPGRNDNILPEKATLALAAGVTCKAMASIPGDKILVAHSQGGAVANATLTTCPNESIIKIIYVTSVVPLHGTGVFSMLEKGDKESYFTGLKYDKEDQLIKVTDVDAMAKNFAHDATQQQLNWIRSQSVNEPTALGSSKVTLDNNRFHEVDKYYVFAKNDKIISHATQQKIANSIDLKNSYTLTSGHLPMLTQSESLAAILLKISNS